MLQGIIRKLENRKEIYNNEMYKYEYIEFDEWITTSMTDKCIIITVLTVHIHNIIILCEVFAIKTKKKTIWCSQK